MSGAGYSRVTHPFAARVPRRAFPLDLHVLSTPPAFVLSQDQTLQQKPVEKQSQQQKSCQRNPKPQRVREKTTWHWLIKHPVEFSKNTHTPNPGPRLGKPSSGQLLRLPRSTPPAQDPRSCRHRQSVSPRAPPPLSEGCRGGPCRPADDRLAI